MLCKPMEDLYEKETRSCCGFVNVVKRLVDIDRRFPDPRD